MAPLWSTALDRFADIEGAVKDILKAVAVEKDTALRRFSQQFDSVALEGDLAVPEQALADAAAAMDPDLKEAITLGVKRLRQYYAALAPAGGWAGPRQAATPEMDLSLRTLPLGRVGVYVPGGGFPLVSSLLMGVIPAQVAGVTDIVVATPPAKNNGGLPNADILGAAHLLGITSVFRVGGAQAIGALAYGTQSVPRVDKIVGPGNRWVACAKKLVYGDVGIDMIAGPTEIFILADAGLKPALVLSDCLAQLEHGPDSRAFVVSPFAESLDRLEETISHLSLDSEMSERLARNLHLVLTPNMDAAADLANAVAPEHLELMVRGPAQVLSRIHHAGAVFLGDYTPEAACDYFAGGNHVLPTEGTARFCSVLGPWDFLRFMPVTHLSETGLKNWLPHGLAFAKAEGLAHHGESLTARFPPPPPPHREGD